MHTATHAPGISRSGAPQLLPQWGRELHPPLLYSTPHPQHRLPPQPSRRVGAGFWHIPTLKLHGRPLPEARSNQSGAHGHHLYRALGIGHFFFFPLPGENKNTRNLGDLIDGMEPGQGAKVPVPYFVRRRRTGAWRAEQAEGPRASSVLETCTVREERATGCFTGHIPRRKGRLGTEQVSGLTLQSKEGPEEGNEN